MELSPLLDEDQQRTMLRMADPSCPNAFILWWKMGLGKTRLALFAFEYSDFERCFVVCRRVAFSDWLKEMILVGLNFSVFEDVVSAKTCLHLRTPDGQPNKVLILVSAGSLKKVLFNHGYVGQMLVVDELYLFGNYKAQRTIELNRISVLCSVRLGLSGTIMPAQDNITIYGQLFALNAHYTLASGSTEFRTKFQDRCKGVRGIEFRNAKGSDEQIQKLLAQWVDVNMPDESPPRQQILDVPKSKEQTELLRNLKETYEIDGKELKFASQITHITNGIANGWLEKEGAPLRLLECPKIDRLAALIDDIVSAGESVVVWCAYHNDIARIANKLIHEWIPFTALEPFNEKRWATGEIKVVLATEANGSSVNHFSQTKYAIYYSMNYKLLDLQQSMKRHDRKSSKHGGAHYYFLQTKGTNDARIHYLVTQSGKSEKQLIDTLASEFLNENPADQP